MITTIGDLHVELTAVGSWRVVRERPVEIAEVRIRPDLTMSCTLCSCGRCAHVDAVEKTSGRQEEAVDVELRQLLGLTLLVIAICGFAKQPQPRKRRPRRQWWQ